MHRVLGHLPEPGSWPPLVCSPLLKESPGSPASLKVHAPSERSETPPPNDTIRPLRTIQSQAWSSGTIPEDTNGTGKNRGSTIALCGATRACSPQTLSSPYCSAFSHPSPHCSPSNSPSKALNGRRPRCSPPFETTPRRKLAARSGAPSTRLNPGEGRRFGDRSRRVCYTSGGVCVPEKGGALRSVRLRVAFLGRRSPQTRLCVRHKIRYMTLRDDHPRDQIGPCPAFNGRFRDQNCDVLGRNVVGTT